MNKKPKLLVFFITVMTILVFTQVVSATQLSQTINQSTQKEKETSTVRVPTVCTDDVNEPNDSQATATILTASASGTNHSGLWICGSNNDYFNVIVPVGETLKVNLNFLAITYDVGIELLDSSGVTLATVYSNSDSATVTYVNSTGSNQTYTIRVYESIGMFGSFFDVEYSLTLTLLPPCTDDSYEPNDLFSNPATLSASVAGTTYSGLMSCKTNVDHYDIIIPAGYTLRIDAQFSHAIADLNISLDDYFWTLDSSYSTTDNETLSYTNTTSANYTPILRVFNSDLNDNPYDLVLTLIPPCADDTMEENDLISNAVPINLVDSPYTNLVLCDTDADFYTVTVPANSAIQVDIEFDTTISDLTLDAYDSTSTFVTNTSSTTTDNERVIITNNSSNPETYTIEVQNPSFSTSPQIATNPYSLTLSSYSCSNDSFENNNYSYQATPVTIGNTYSNLQLCFGDTDYYVISLTAGQTIAVDVIFDHLDETRSDTTDIDLGVIDFGYNEYESASITDNENIVYTASTAGDYFISVYVNSEYYSWEGGDNSYSLEVKSFEVSHTSPANGSIANTSPTLTWDSATYTAKYDVEVYDLNGSLVHNPTGLTNTSYQVPAGLADGTYSWRVRATATNQPNQKTSFLQTTWSNTTNWSSQTSFIIESSPSHEVFIPIVVR